MKLGNIKIKAKDLSSWIASMLSVFTLVMSPVAMGKEAESISKQQAVSALKEMGLDKEITVGEFYQKTKDLYPERIRAQIEPVMLKYKNLMMPKFTVATVKGSDGKDIPSLQVTQNGQLLNIQLYGQQDKYAKFQNTNLSEVDIINFNDMFERINAGDAVLRKQSDVVNKAPNKTFTEFPSLTKESWLAMTPKERAAYMISLRLLWSDAKKVLTEVSLEKNKSSKGKKTSLNSLPVNTFEAFLKLFVTNAEAVDAKVNPESSDDCLVAGYVTTYNSAVCDHKNIKAVYRDFPLVAKANEVCGPKMLACNPVVFGTPGGKPICLNPGKNNDFQIATHYNGPCETIKGAGLNHLSTNVDFLVKDKTKGRYDASNLNGTDLEADAKKFQGPDYKQTESFLEGILKFNGKSIYTAKGDVDSESLKEILKIKENFQSDIKDAASSCIASSDKRADHEKNFWKACDQLQRRFLFVAEFFQTKCADSSKIDASTLQCVCPNTVSVNPGASCKDTVAPVTPPASGTTPPVATTPADGNEKCPDGQVAEAKPGIPGSSGAGAVYTDCKPKKDIPKEPSFWDKLWKGAKKVAPYAFAGAALFAMYKIFQPKVPNRKSAKDLCPNGSVAPCGQSCTPPLAKQSNGDCACSSCPPGQTITNASTCSCGSLGSSGTGTSSVLITCPDNVTLVTNLSMCPAPQYTCWDGSKVSNALNCPEKPATTTPKTGTQN